MKGSSNKSACLATGSVGRSREPRVPHAVRPTTGPGCLKGGASCDHMQTKHARPVHPCPPGASARHLPHLCGQAGDGPLLGRRDDNKEKKNRQLCVLRTSPARETGSKKKIRTGTRTDENAPACTITNGAEEEKKGDESTHAQPPPPLGDRLPALQRPPAWLLLSSPSSSPPGTRQAPTTCAAASTLASVPTDWRRGRGSWTG